MGSEMNTIVIALISFVAGGIFGIAAVSVCSMLKGKDIHEPIKPLDAK